MPQEIAPVLHINRVREVLYVYYCSCPCVFPSEISAKAVCTSWPCTPVLSDCLRAPESPCKWHYCTNMFTTDIAPIVQRQRAKIHIKSWQATSVLASVPEGKEVRQLLMRDRIKNTQMGRADSRELRFKTWDGTTSTSSRPAEQQHQQC